MAKDDESYSHFANSRLSSAAVLKAMIRLRQAHSSSLPLPMNGRYFCMSRMAISSIAALHSGVFAATGQGKMGDVISTVLGFQRRSTRSLLNLPRDSRKRSRMAVRPSLSCWENESKRLARFLSSPGLGLGW